MRINRVYMSGLMDAVGAANPPEGTFALFWLGQAGFLIKTARGHTIGIDPCLSDYCSDKCGIKRLIPAVCSPREFSCDTLLISHEHEDHFDGDLIASMTEGGRFSRLLGPCSIASLADTYAPNAPYTELRYDSPIGLPGVTVTPVFSDHGANTPDSMGFIFDFGALRLYYAGDTAYSPKLLRSAFDARPDIAVMPINGQFGNLDAKNAYALAGEMGCKALIPCHYWMYAVHGSCPLELLRLEQKGEGPDIVWLALGEGWIPHTEPV